MNDSRHVILFFPQSVRKSWIWKWLFFFRFSLIFTQKNLRSFTMKRKWINQKKRILTPRKKMVPWYEKYLEVLFLSKICLFFTYFPSVSLNALQKLKILLFTNNIFNKILETRCFEIKYRISRRLNYNLLIRKICISFQLWQNLLVFVYWINCRPILLNDPLFLKSFKFQLIVEWPLRAMKRKYRPTCRLRFRFDFFRDFSITPTGPISLLWH